MMDDLSTIAGAAAGGDDEARDRLVARLSPLLHAQAKVRLGKFARLRGRVSPEDLVAEAWLRTLPRLGEITPTQASLTRAILAFASKTLLYVLNDVVDKAYGNKPEVVPIADSPSEAGAALPAADVTGVVTRALREERAEEVTRAIEGLGYPDRDLVLMRGIEGVPNKDVAALLGIPPKTASMRYARALDRLREALPNSILDELQERSLEP